MQNTQTSAIQRITLSNNKNLRVVIANYGARILSIEYKNSAGSWLETTLNYSLDSDILDDDCYMGATCGRVSNRISGAHYVHQGKNVILSANENKSMLHGGPGGFSHCFWLVSNVTTRSDSSQSVTLTYVSNDGDQGFPGNLTAHVTYTVSSDDHLTIEYKATSDKVSPINMCNHAYFTLAEPSIHNLYLRVFADKYLPVDHNSIPTGEILTARDDKSFVKPVSLGKRINLHDIDDCYILRKKSSSETMQSACILVSKINDIALTVATNQAALQVYTGNYLPIKHSAIALEAQGLVDAVNQAGFETDWVGPNQDYQKIVDYHFQSTQLYI